MGAPARQVTAGFPNQPQPTLVSPKPFSIEHRDLIDLATFQRHIAGAGPDRLPSLLSDFHLLFFLSSLHVLEPVRSDKGSRHDVV